MKTAVIADIHSNHAALASALSLVDKIKPDHVLFLGDYVSDCPCPQKTMRLLDDFRGRFHCFFIRGNREDYMINHRAELSNDWRYSSQTGSLLYTYENLTSANLDFFAGLPICLDISFDGYPTITACHGSPISTREWLPGNDALLGRYTKEMKGEILLCGHTHRYETHSYNGKTVVFCPSVGLPMSKENIPYIVLLSLEDGAWSFDLLPVSYDVDRLVREFDESGLSEKAMVWARCIQGSLLTGRDYSMECLRLASKMAKEDGCTDARIPECYWNAAAKEIGI